MVGMPSKTDELYYPPDDIVESANAPDYESIYARAQEDLAAFWAERAEELAWYAPWEQILDEPVAAATFEDNPDGDDIVFLVTPTGGVFRFH